MEREPEEVHVEMLDVNGVARHELRAVDEQHRTVVAVGPPIPTGMRDLSHRRQRRLGAKEVRSGGAAEQLGATLHQGRKMIKIELAGAVVEVRHPILNAAVEVGRISRLKAYHGTKLELCSIIVVTTLSPSRNSLSRAYMTALIASVALRYMTMFRRLGACSQSAMMS